jgi:hypothetical protein
MADIEYPVHPAAELFPMMSEEELLKLAEDIERNGQLEPIWLHDNSILDGRNRLAACKLAGIAPRFAEAPLNGCSPVLFVNSMNLVRRHLTKHQCATIGAEMMPFLQADAKERQRQSGSEYGRGGIKVGDISPQPMSANGKQRNPRARDIAAHAVGVNARMIDKALAVKKACPAEFERIRRGKADVYEVHSRVVLGTPLSTASKFQRSIWAKGAEQSDANRQAFCERVVKLADSGLAHTETSIRQMSGIATINDFLARARMLPWLTVLRTPEGTRFLIDDDLRAICEDAAPRSQLGGVSIRRFIRDLTREIDRQRKENCEKQKSKNWLPDNVIKLEQKLLLDWIEEQLTKLNQLMTTSGTDNTPDTRTQDHPSGDAKEQAWVIPRQTLAAKF